MFKNELLMNLHLHETYEKDKLSLFVLFKLNCLYEKVRIYF